MSVFQLHDWWSTNISTGEEFDIGSLAIGNIDNSNPSSGLFLLSFFLISLIYSYFMFLLFI